MQFSVKLPFYSNPQLKIKKLGDKILKILVVFLSIWSDVWLTAKVILFA